MNYINLGYGYRLHRRDSRNWELQRFREIKQSNNPKARSGVSEWFNCGKFYQSLRAALLAVYELVLREWMARTHTTKAELAKMVGVTGCMPSQWLHGAKEPRMSTMLNLADATGMSVYDLMEVDDA